MTNIEIAEKEVELYRKWKGGTYGSDLADSTLKAFLAIIEKDFSDFSNGVVVNLLTRLLKGLPLTPITDNDFLENIVIIGGDEYLKANNLKYSLPCKRLKSLYKEETLDGKVSYTDVDRVICRDENDHSFSFSCNLGDKTVDKMFPITMPYYPPVERYVVVFRNKKPIWVETPEGEKVMVEE